MRKLLENRYVKIAAILFFASFFLGYSLRFLDFITDPPFGRIGVIYPIHEEFQRMHLLERAAGIGGYENVGESPIDLLYVLRNNAISAILLVTIGVLAGIPTAIYLFLIGITAGASIPEVLEFASLWIAAKTIFSFLFYTAAVITAGSLGIEAGKGVVDFMRGNRFAIERSAYDRALLLFALVILNVILQYFLLVAK